MDKIISSFIDTYYSSIMHKGYSSVFRYFRPNVKCVFNNTFSEGAYNIVLSFADLGIKSQNFYNITYVYQTLGSNSNIIINIHGYIKGHTYYNTETEPIKFSEILILDVGPDNNVLISNIVMIFV